MKKIDIILSLQYYLISADGILISIDTAIKKLKKLQPHGTIIYRYGSHTYYNLTPRNTDLDGLSFFAGIPTAKCVLTTVEWVRSTGTLYANNNHGNHYGILPVKGDLKAWMVTKNTANTNPHEYSITLKNITIPI